MSSDYVSNFTDPRNPFTYFLLALLLIGVITGMVRKGGRR